MVKSTVKMRRLSLRTSMRTWGAGIAASIFLAFVTVTFCEGQDPPLREADSRGRILPTGAVVRLGTSSYRTTGPISSMTFSPDGRVLCCGGWNGVVTCFDAHQGGQVTSLAASGGAVSSVAFTGANEIACAGDDGKIRLFDLQAPRQTRVLSAHHGPVRALHYSSARCLLVSGGEDGQVLLWQREFSDRPRVLGRHLGPALQVSSSRDGGLVASLGRDGVLKTWRTIQVDVTTERAVYPEGVPLFASFSILPNDAALLVFGRGVSHWDGTPEGKIDPVPTSRDCGWYSTILSPVGDRLATYDLHDSVSVFHLPSFNHERSFRLHPGLNQAGAQRMAFSPDGALLAVAAGILSQALLVFDVESGCELVADQGHSADVTWVHFFNECRSLASYGKDATIRLWDVASGRHLARKTIEGPVLACDISEHGSPLVVASASGLTIFSGEHLEESAVVSHENIRPGCLFLTPDGGRIIVAQSDSIAIWDVRLRQIVSSLPAPGLECIALSPSGDSVAYVARRLLHVVPSALTGEGVEIGSVVDAEALAISPGGNDVLSMGDHSIAQWATGTRTAARKTRFPDRLHTSFSFSPDAKAVALGFANGDVKILEVPTLAVLAVFHGHTGACTSLSFSSDGRLLASGSSDTGVLVWRIPP